MNSSQGLDKKNIKRQAKIKRLKEQIMSLESQYQTCQVEEKKEKILLPNYMY